MAENTILPNPEKLENLIKSFIKEGKDKLHVLADFDRTLTKCFVAGQKSSTIFAQIRNLGYLGDDYVQKAHQLFDYYHPIEIDPNIDLKQKRQKMAEWWRKHFELVIEKCLTKQIIKEVVAKGGIAFREGINDFLDMLKDNNVPLVILSSSGLGNAIPMYFAKIQRNYPNIFVLSNFFNFDNTGKAISVRPPLIHVLNKKEITLESLPIYNQLQKRKNVLLLGDGVADIDMVAGFDHDNLIKVGFLNENVAANLESFKNNFDVIILNDGNMEYVNDLIKKIL